ncbi:MAG: homoserine dehydrogenase [Acidimicrobiales bacterium]
MKIGLLGCGNVGSAFIKLLIDNRESIKERCGEDLELAAVVVRDLDRERPEWVDPALLTTDARSVVLAPDIDLIVEVIGDVTASKELIEAALQASKSVVTANKALLAESYFELEDLAETVGKDIFFEAAVAGGIPLIRSLRVSLVGERLSRVTGIVNGTTNFILTRMYEENLSFSAALKLAQELGYVEADPRADLEGFDAAAKAAILASIAFGRKVRFNDVQCEGIVHVRESDVNFARRHGFVVKLLAQCERIVVRSEDDEFSVRVFPALLPETHPLAAVRDAFNAVFVEGEAVGELMFYGRGAGGLPTASAVMGDVIDAAQNLRFGSTERRTRTKDARIVDYARLTSQFYVSVEVVDEPGVLASVAEIFGANEVSISSMEQIGLADEARLVFLTHPTTEGSIARTLEGLRRLRTVKEIGHSMRVITEG